MKIKENLESILTTERLFIVIIVVALILIIMFTIVSYNSFETLKDIQYLNTDTITTNTVIKPDSSDYIKEYDLWFK